MPIKSHNFPSGWTTARLASLCDVLIGGTPSRNKQEFWDASKSGKNVWVSIADLSKLNGKYISDSSEYISDEGVRRSNVKKVLPGTVLMSFKLSIGKVAIAKTPLFTNEAIAAFNIKQPDRIVSDYLYYLLPTLEYETDQAIKGKTLNKEKLNEVELTLPSLNEQKKIAEILSAVDGEIQKTEAIISATEKMKRGLMKTLFNSDQMVLLDSVAKRGSGHTPNKQHPEYWNGGIKWVSLADSQRLDNRYIHETDKQISLQGIEHSSAVLHSRNTVIICRDAGIGRVAILRDDDMAVSQHFIAWKCGENLNFKYLYYWLQSQKNTFEQIATGTTIKTIGLSFFKNLQIPFLNMHEQEKIGYLFWSVDDRILTYQTLKAKLALLKKGLMRDLLSGSVRVN